MAKSRSQRQVYTDLLDRYGRMVAEAFMRAMEDLRSGAELQRVTAFIENGDIDGALEALHIDPEAFNEMADKIREAHQESGRLAAEGMPKRRPDGTALVMRFDGRNPEAESWLNRHSSDLITRITDDQRAMIRISLTDSMRRGVNPRQAALDIVGRVNRATGRREGGVLGLTQTQAEYVATARQEMASSDPAALKNYLARGRRDKRFDRSIAKAIREERPVDPAIAAKALIAYERRLLQLRGETIGHLETFASMEVAKERAYLQAVESGKVPEAAVSKGWRHLNRRNPRHQHRAMDGKRVGLRAYFVMPDGTRMRHAHDPEAPVSHLAGCICQTDYKIDFLANLD